MSPTKIGILKLSFVHYFVLGIKFGVRPQDFGNAHVQMLGLPIFYPIESNMETKEAMLETIQEKQTLAGQNIILIKRIIIAHSAQVVCLGLRKSLQT